MSALNVNEVVREVLALVAAELRRQNVDVSTELDSELPSVVADFVQLQQVMLNLVMNAIESMASIADRPDYYGSNPACTISLGNRPFLLQCLTQAPVSAPTK